VSKPPNVSIGAGLQFAGRLLPFLPVSPEKAPEADRRGGPDAPPLGKVAKGVSVGQALLRLLRHPQEKYTAIPSPAMLSKLLHELQDSSSVLVVLNHPFWSTDGVDPKTHRSSLVRFIEEHRELIHALEINGLRPRSENRTVMELARGFDLPLISGGDRHGCEPNATLNVTAAGTFDEFVEEIRRDRLSKIVLMPQYFEPLKLRLFAETWHILGEAPGEFGRRNWTARVFYITKEGVERPASFLWGKEGPRFIKQIHWAMGLIANPWFRPAVRMAMLTSWEEGL